MSGEKPVGPGSKVATSAWLHDHVQMIGHDTSRQNRHSEFVEGFGEQPEEGNIVRAVVKEPHAVIATIHDVVAVVRDDGA